MKKVIAVLILMLGLANCQAAQEEKSKRLVLPNPKLLRCKSSDCFQLWLETPAETNAVFPNHLMIDMKENCLYGFTAIYDKSIPVDDVKVAIDELYGKWAVADFSKGPLWLWRVEPERFAISLKVADKKDEKMHFAEAGSKQAIYIAFASREQGACDVH